MKSLEAPWALAGLLAIPVLLWLHRRRHRAAPIDLPSLLFLTAADEVESAARRTKPDAELWLALAAATLLTLAAAGPTTRDHGEARSVRVVVDVGAAMAARSADGTTAASRAEAVVDEIRRALRSDDDFARADASDTASDSSAGFSSGLLGAVLSARGGAPSLRVLVTDRRRPDLEADGLRVVAVGDAAIADAGIASVDVESPPQGSPPGAPRRVFVNVRNDGPVERRLSLRVEGGAGTTIVAPAFAAASATLDAPGVPSDGAATPIVVRLDDKDGALAEGDEVRVEPAALAVSIAGPDEGLAAAYGELIRTTLAVVAPGFVETSRDRAAIRFCAGADCAAASGSGAGLSIVLHPIEAGKPAAAVTTRGPYDAPASEVGRDLDPSGCELSYANSVFRGGPANPPWPIVRRAGPHAVEWLPDPLAGSPAPANHPIWPLFVENAVVLATGTSSGAGPRAGYRVRGLLDPAAATLGRDRVPWDLRWLADAPVAHRSQERPLRPLLVGLAIVALVLAWGRAVIARAGRIARPGTVSA